MMFLARIICAHQAENPVGLVGIRCPDFLTIDDKMIAHIFAFRCERGEVRPRAGF